MCNLLRQTASRNYLNARCLQLTMGKVGTDLFTIYYRNYLVTVDYASGFIEVNYLPDTLSETVVAKMKHHFARYSVPDVVVSDGRPQYTSTSFKH